jgi:hypothetical protein
MGFRSTFSVACSGAAFYASLESGRKGAGMELVSDRPEGQQLEKQDVLPELNARVHEAAKRFEGAEPERDLWDFTCECGTTDCRGRVSLALAEYEALRAANRPVLALGHEPVGSTPA